MVLVESVPVSKLKFNYGEMRSNAEKIEDAVVKRRVLKGMEILQRKYGEEWVDHIDPKTLDLSDGSRCILGQVYRDFTDGLDALGIKGGERYGFDSDGPRVDFDVLDRAWQHVFTGKS